MTAITELRDSAALASALAERLAEHISDAVTWRGQATLALAGGRTPMPAYRDLARRALPWHAVSLIPTDERWVDAGHPARNDDEIAECFAPARGVRILPLVPRQATHPPVLSTAAASLAALPPFDAVVLGMGGDAHTASLFPRSAGLAPALDADAGLDAAVITPEPLPPEAPYPRVTLTASRLLRARALIVAITGDGKRSVWNAAVDAGDPLDAPIAVFARQTRVPLSVFWSP